MSAPSEVDTAKADRKLWLVKVPQFVAEVWRAACETSSEGEALQDKGGGKELGKITIARNLSTGQTDLMLKLTDAPANVPTDYTLHAAQDVASMSCVSYPKVQDSPASQPPQLHGRVECKFDALPAVSASAAGAKGGVMGLDPLYAQVSKQRTARAMEKGRSVVMYDDKSSRSRGMAAGLPGNLKLKRPTEMSLSAKQDAKRLKMDKDELEKLLFTLFEGQPHWNFVQLQRETHQPGPYLKDVLAGIATLNRRGQHAGSYELKPEYGGQQQQQ